MRSIFGVVLFLEAMTNKNNGGKRYNKGNSMSGILGVYNVLFEIHINKKTRKA